MIDSQLRRNALGFLEVVDRPKFEKLREYYATVHYQNEKGSYRKEYPPEELESFILEIAQRTAQAANNFFSTLADVGLYRNLIAFLRPDLVSSDG